MREIDIVNRLQIKAQMIDMGERIALGSDTALMREAATEIDRLRRIIDSRPAINAGLPETYIEWSQGIYMSDIAQCVGLDA